LTTDRKTRIAQENRSGASKQKTRGTVGIVSDGQAGMLEVACLLRREEMAVSQALGVGAARSSLLDGLRALHRDPDTEAIVLISKMSAPDSAKQALGAVRESAKPTVVCFLGADQRLIWRTGAIPAARLDEAAWRAAAWVRGWDQALVSSRLQDQDEQLADLAENLRADIGCERWLIRGLFTSRTFREEARLMLADVAGAAAGEARLELGTDLAWQLCAAQEALTEAGVCVLLLDMVLSRGAKLSSMGALADLLGRDRHRSLVIAHVCGVGDDPKCLVEQETELRDAGVILTASNALAARLAGMLSRRSIKR
jgi:FdrA protein